MRNGRRPPATTRQFRAATPPAVQPKRWISVAACSEPKGFQNMKQSYVRYLSLAGLRLKTAIRSRLRTTTSTPNIILGRCFLIDRERRSRNLHWRGWSHSAAPNELMRLYHNRFSERSCVAQVIAARTGMSQADAKKRVDQVVALAQAKTDADDAQPRSRGARQRLIMRSIWSGKHSPVSNVIWIVSA